MLVGWPYYYSVFVVVALCSIVCDVVGFVVVVEKSRSKSHQVKCSLVLILAIILILLTL